jgi:hypothetical protein
METESTISARRTREIRKRSRRIEKKTKLSESPPAKRTSDEQVELRKRELEESRPERHSYLTYTMFLAIQFLISGLNSFRGIAKTFEILAIHQPCSVPNFNTIRQWVLRLGLSELNRPKEYRSDWIFIVDMTIEIGKNKCLVILGISQERLETIVKKEARSLQHQDVEVLSLEILDSTVGTIILDKLNNLAKRVGTPIQIVSDRGSDLKKGIDLYLEHNLETIATYDITHKMANLLKQELSKDRRFQEFFKECSLTRQRVQQTNLCFLSPPTQRAKSRYHNLDILISWAITMTKYEERQDFSAIDNTYFLDREAYRLLRPSVDKSTMNLLKRAESVRSGSPTMQPTQAVKSEVYESLEKFSQAMSNVLTIEIWQVYGEKICQAASLGRRQFYEKLGWLFDYRSEIQTYAELLALINSVQTQIKSQGLHRQSCSQWLESFSPPLAPSAVNPIVYEFHRQIEAYLVEETTKITTELTLLGSSDVIESLFGKYKTFAQRRPIKELGASILLIPLSTIQITMELVKEAMESISFIDVSTWTKSIFGSSMLSRRRNLNLSSNSDTEPA